MKTRACAAEQSCNGQHSADGPILGLRVACLSLMPGMQQADLKLESISLLSRSTAQFLGNADFVLMSTTGPCSYTKASSMTRSTWLQIHIAMQGWQTGMDPHSKSNGWSRKPYLEQISQGVDSTHLILSAGARLHDALEHTASIRAKQQCRPRNC